jgi:hypothetical protein
MDDGAPIFVEFVGEGDSEPSRDEVIPGPSQRGPSRLLVIGALLLAVAAVGWARSLNDSSSGGPAADRPSASASARPVGAIADPSTLENSPYALLGPCPAGAQCFLSAPATAASALRAAFPGAVLLTTASILANRAGHIDPGLLRRVILAERGDQAIQVRIQAGPAPGSDFPRRPWTPSRTARVTVQREGYVISVAVIGPKSTRTTEQATRLANDLRLLATA